MKESLTTLMHFVKDSCLDGLGALLGWLFDLRETFVVCAKKAFCLFEFLHEFRVIIVHQIMLVLENLEVTRIKIFWTVGEHFKHLLTIFNRSRTHRVITKLTRHLRIFLHEELEGLFTVAIQIVEVCGSLQVCLRPISHQRFTISSGVSGVHLGHLVHWEQRC